MKSSKGDSGELDREERARSAVVRAGNGNVLL